MHKTALDFARAHVAAHGPYRHVVEFGSLNINGTPRVLFDEGTSYVGVDLQDGPGVDVVSDILDVTVEMVGSPVLLVCLEVLAHAPDQRGVIDKAAELLAPGGTLVLTAACDPRAPHSAVDELPIRPWEHYRNAVPAELQDWLTGWSSVHALSTEVLGDVYLCAIR